MTDGFEKEEGDGLVPVSFPVLPTNVPESRLYSNIRINATRALPWIDHVTAHEHHAVIVGGGPSLQDTVEEIRLRQSWGQHVFALNNVAAWLIERGIVPYAQIILDARASNVRFLTHKAPIRYFICSQCDPALFNYLHHVPGADVMLWHPNMDGESGVEITRPTVLIGGGSSVGIRAMSIVHVLGYRQQHLYGFDSSYRQRYGHAYQQPENDTDDCHECVVYGRKFSAASWMIKQAQAFPDMAVTLAEQGTTVTVKGDGLLPWIAHQLAALPQAVERGERQSELTAFYDLRCCPVSYDFVVFLALAEKARQARGLHRLKIVIVPGPDEGFNSEIGSYLDNDHKRQMLWGIVLGLCRLVPSVGTIVLANSRDEAASHEQGETFPDRYSVDFPFLYYGITLLIQHQKRHDVSCFYAPEWSRKHVKQWMRPETITITLRETHYAEGRNSDCDEWVQAARILWDHGYNILFLRDAALAHGESFHGWPVCHVGSLDVSQRLAVYETATVSLFAANGPFTLALLAPNVRGIVFGLLMEDDIHAMSSQNWYSREFPPGSQFQFVAPRFKCVWERDTSEVIVRETLNFTLSEGQKTWMA